MILPGIISLNICAILYWVLRKPFGQMRASAKEIVFTDFDQIATDSLIWPGINELTRSCLRPDSW